MRILKKQRQAVLVATILAGLIVVAGFGRVAWADPSIPPATSEQLAIISQNCIQIKSTLQQLGQNDLLVRNNVGQYYDEISSDLMGPMNSRIALNHFDGADLVTTAASYSSQITTFRTDYLSYASKLQTVLGDNCSNTNQFYTDLITAQQARQTLGQDVTALNSSITQYGQQFSDFAKNLPAGGSNG